MDSRPTSTSTGSAVVRPARLEDGDALTRIDDATWNEAVSPAPRPPSGRRFFDGRTTPADVLVAEAEGVVAGYVSLGRATPVPASDHVVVITGLAVDPALQGRGVGRALVEAAVADATRRGARRITLRVLAPNEPARALYASCGFTVEGVLRGEFRLGDRYVDDVLMARALGGRESGRAVASSGAAVS
jgi:ribosomal protein S18 acetylase RimI-like enzyme